MILYENSDEQIQENYEEEKYFVNLKIFTNILWLYEPIDETDKNRMNALVQNLYLLYGRRKIKILTNTQDILTFVENKQEKGEQLYYQLNNLAQNFSHMLVICQDKHIKFFADHLSHMRQIYHKCIVFDPSSNGKKRQQDKQSNKYKLKNYVQKTINQVYDLVGNKVMEDLEKNLQEKKKNNFLSMFQLFNIYLDHQKKTCKTPQLQLNKSNDFSSQLDLKCVQKMELSIVRQILQIQFISYFSPQQQAIIFVTTLEVKKQLQRQQITNQNIKLICSGQLQQALAPQQQKCRLKIILTCHTVLPTALVDSQQVFSVMRCRWKDESLTRQQMQQYSNTRLYKYLQQQQKSNQSKIKNVDKGNYQKELEAVQIKLEEQLYSQ